MKTQCYHCQEEFEIDCSLCTRPLFLQPIHLHVCPACTKREEKETYVSLAVDEDSKHVRINMLRALGLSTHYHSCPSCYEKWGCKLECTIEPDLEDPVCHPGKEFGSHSECPRCISYNQPLTQEWWNKYNGIK